MKKKFGDRLRSLRLQRGFTQEKIAEVIGISTENYSRIENGLSFPKPENIEKISLALEVEVLELFQFSNPNGHLQILEKLIPKLETDKESALLTYKFLRSLGKI